MFEIDRFTTYYVTKCVGIINNWAYTEQHFVIMGTQLARLRSL